MTKREILYAVISFTLGFIVGMLAFQGPPTPTPPLTNQMTIHDYSCEELRMRIGLDQSYCEATNQWGEDIECVPGYRMSPISLKLHYLSRGCGN